jgi:two-component system sensor histidine kinase UhpB
MSAQNNPGESDGSLRHLVSSTSAEDRLRLLGLLLDAVQQAVIATDLEGIILYWNRFAEHLYGWSASEVIGKNIADVLMPVTERAHGHKMIAKWPEGARAPREWLLQRRDGTPVEVQANPMPILDEDSNMVGVVGVSWDISERKKLESERKRTEEVLRKSEWQLAEAQKLAHVGSWERDLETGAVTLSGEAARMFFGDERRKSSTFNELAELIHPDDRAYVRQVRASNMAWEVEYRIVRADGAVRVLHTRAEVVRNETDQPIRVIGSNLDITERHQAQAELREKRIELQALSRRLLEAQEAERRLLARELHDNFGQSLTAIRMNLEAHGASSDHLTESIALVDQAIEQVRTLALDLRPSILDDLGLVAALRWLVNRQSRRGDIEWTFRASTSDGRLPAAIETCCFRLAQEALTNVVRHAAARHVSIELRFDDTQVELVVRDDGQGFDVRLARDRAAHGASLGLVSMEERVALAGGMLQLESAPERGTTIRARFPHSAKGPS